MAVTMSVLVVVWVTDRVSVSVLVVVDTLLFTLVTVGRREEKIPFHGRVQRDGARKAIYSQYMHIIPQTTWQTHL